MKSYLFLSLCMSIALIACSKKNIDDTTQSINPDEVVQIATSQSATSWDLLRESYEVKENSLISPLSIQLALYMASAGADGNTLSEMNKNLRVDNLPNVHDSASKLMKYMEKTSESGKLRIENAAFYDDNRINVVDEFKNTLEKDYSAQFEGLNFSDSERAKSTINSWAENATEGKIKEVLQEINSDDVMFILNAIYMKADWNVGFEPEWTREIDFTNSSGIVEKVDMLSDDRNATGFTDDEYTYLELPLSDSTYVGKFILPKTSDIKTFINQLDDDMFASIQDRKQTKRFMISIPKLEIKYKKQINNWLKNMGIEEAFQESNADFSKLGKSGGNIFISRVLHDTYFKMDEGGIEGAAVTTIGMTATSLPPSLHFNKPFVLVIEERETGVPIFSGIIQTIE